MRRHLAWLLVCLVVALGVALVAGRQSLLGAPASPPSSDAVRLGPGPGQPVADYLAMLPPRLPPTGAPPVPALVQLAVGLDTTEAADLLTGAPSTELNGPPTVVWPVIAVFRVPLPRVQTALRFQPLTQVADPDPIAAVRRQLALAQVVARRTAATEAGRLRGRPARVAAAEAAALSTPGCRCVLAVLVSADRAGLDGLAGRPGVRAVDAAPAGTPTDGVALAPLLPEQTGLVGPVPDDGPLPP
ncbi:MAG: hypothetical protein ACR2G2_01940 [Pseudonocardia sp.]